MPQKATAGAAKPAAPVATAATDKPATFDSVHERLRAIAAEYLNLTGDRTGAAITRRHQLIMDGRVLKQWLRDHEELVDITIPKTVLGFPLRINKQEYNPGRHRVRASVASQLLFMIDQDRRGEIKRMQDNGRNVDLGEIGQKARMAAIQRED